MVFETTCVRNLPWLECRFFIYLLMLTASVSRSLRRRETQVFENDALGVTERWAHDRATVLPASLCLMTAFPPQDPQYSERDV